MMVCHMTDAHSALDDRIYLKECISLSQAGYDTYLVAKGDSCISRGVHIIGCGESKGRIDRMLFFSRKIYKRAASLDCDIYHIHDPELLPYALKLKRKGKKVIFDSHEDIPAQILDKEWIPSIFRRAVSCGYRLYESYIIKQIDAVIAATPYIARQFRERTSKIVTVGNYPRLDDIVFHDTPFDERRAVICYAGGIDDARGESIMTKAVKDLDVTLILAGDHKKERRGNIKYLGNIDRDAVNKLYGQAVAGFVLLRSKANYVNSLPIKMFEYMAAGLPFIASAFPIWDRIANTYQCGICVPIEDQDKIRKAVSYILTNREAAEKMGRNGRKVVEKRYNWNLESQKLISLYKSLDSEKDTQEVGNRAKNK